MSTTQVQKEQFTFDYSNFKPDGWDALGATGELVKAELEIKVKDAFGATGVSAIQQKAIADAAYHQYQAQEALRAAAKAAQDAAKYADLPDSPLYQNAVATVKANENIAASAVKQATQIMDDAKVNGALAGNIGKVASVLGPAINAAQLGSAMASGDAYEVGKTSVSVLAGMAFGALATAAVTALGAPILGVAAAGIVVGFAASSAWKWMWDNGAADYYGIKPGDEFSLQRTSDALLDILHSFWGKAETARSPLILDLDGDG